VLRGLGQVIRYQPVSRRGGIVVRNTEAPKEVLKPERHILKIQIMQALMSQDFSTPFGRDSTRNVTYLRMPAEPKLLLREAELSEQIGEGRRIE
jgi:hypothetical protein